MCGIAGIHGSGDVRAMAARLVHRGPDAEGYYEDGPIHLGARRLSIIDLPGGQQPLCSDDGRHWIVYNGELFNYVELRSELEAAGCRFRTRADTEVVVNAYQQWGPRCLERFNGMFAFAVWNGRELFLARDRMGEKPLYYARDGARLLFASEIKGILAELPARPRLDDRFPVLETILEPDTLFEGVYSLEPGHCLTFDGNQLRIRRYWSLPEAPALDRPLDDLAEELRAVLADAVRLRLRSDVPLGVFLSGGLDSSMLAALARADKVFICHLPYGPAYDEFRHAQRMAEHLGARAFTVTVGPEDFRRELPRIIWHLEQPLSTMSSVAEFAVARLAREHVKVALGGQGADEAFGGYVRYVLMTEEERLGGSELLRDYHPLCRVLWGRGVFGPPAERYFSLLQRGKGSAEVARRARATFEQRSGSLVDRMGALDFAVTFPSLITMNDRAAAAYSVENRTPFLDHRVLELAFRLPQRAKIDGLSTKVVLRKAARGLIPDAIIDRVDKKGLAVPVGAWLQGDLKDWATELADSLARRGVDFEPAAERGAFDRTLFTKVCLETWFRTFIDGQGRGPVA
jgi:asparagine synthase (glutamine-hydrolysing)